MLVCSKCANFVQARFAQIAAEQIARKSDRTSSERASFLFIVFVSSLSSLLITLVIQWILEGSSASQLKKSNALKSLSSISKLALHE